MGLAQTVHGIVSMRGGRGGGPMAVLQWRSLRSDVWKVMREREKVKGKDENLGEIQKQN